MIGRIQKLLDCHEESFHEAWVDIDKMRVAKALDDGDAMLLMKIIRDDMEAMCDSKDDHTYNDVDDKVDDILQREIEDEAA